MNIAVCKQVSGWLTLDIVYTWKLTYSWTLYHLCDSMSIFIKQMSLSYHMWLFCWCGRKYDNALLVTIDKLYLIQYLIISPNFLIIPKSTVTIEALRERRPPWPRQIITPILPTVEMLSLGGEKKKKKKKKRKFVIITCTTIWVCYHYYGVCLLIHSSSNTQITTKV